MWDIALETVLCPCGSPAIRRQNNKGRNSKWCRAHMLWAIGVRHRLKIDDDMIEALLVLKDDGCSICGSHYLMSIDHCHETGTVRGWLCRKCNSGLGFFGDDIDRLRAALKYLEG